METAVWVVGTTLGVAFPLAIITLIGVAPKSLWHVLLWSGVAGAVLLAVLCLFDVFAQNTLPSSVYLVASFFGYTLVVATIALAIRSIARMARRLRGGHQLAPTDGTGAH